MNWHFIEPLDVLFLRANKLFGDPGSYGESLVPPWPSAAAGAIRSAILARDGVDFSAFAKEEFHPTLGTPDAPGVFRLIAFRLARRENGRWLALYPQPADLVVSKMEDDEVRVQRLQPTAMAAGIQCSIPTGSLPVLTQSQRAKPDSGWWLTEAGYRVYLNGGTPEPPEKEKETSVDLTRSGQLWQMDERVGVGLDGERRRAEDGKLFTVQAVAFHEGVGFLVATEGDALYAETLLRLGGDGRGARILPLGDYQPPQADLEAIAAAGRARIILTAPGIFPDGWRLPGMAEDGRFELCGVRGRVVAAAVNRAEVISGWDLAKRRPKTARRAAPAGSVYWLEDLEAAPEALRKLAKHGLWPETGYDASRRAEGFNRFDWGVWK